MKLDLSMPILVVDDQMVVKRLLQGILKAIGFESVDLATDGSEALGLLRAKPYGLVISDIGMEPMDGLQLLRAMRADSALRSLPVLIMTGSTAPDKVRAAKLSGVNGYIIKPFGQATLRQRIETVLEAARA